MMNRRDFHLCGIAALLLFAALAGPLAALEIGVMKWTPRPDWITVKTSASLTGGPNAIGDGVADDTAAIKAY